MLTHMNPTMLAKVEEARAAGLLIAEDGDGAWRFDRHP